MGILEEHQVLQNVDEVKKTVFKLNDFLNLSEIEKQKLKEAIVATNGTIELWVHTHYDEQLEINSTDENLTQYKKDLEKFIQQGMRGKIPVLSFNRIQSIITWG